MTGHFRKALKAKKFAPGYVSATSDQSHGFKIQAKENTVKPSSF
jgi:hypothetical protein